MAQKIPNPPPKKQDIDEDQSSIKTFCLGNGALGCDGCGQEKNWQTLNQLPDALRKSIQAQAIRIDDTQCILLGRPYYFSEKEIQK